MKGVLYLGCRQLVLWQFHLLKLRPWERRHQTDRNSVWNQPFTWRVGGDKNTNMIISHHSRKIVTTVPVSYSYTVSAVDLSRSYWGWTVNVTWSSMQLLLEALKLSNKVSVTCLPYRGAKSQPFGHVNNSYRPFTFASYWVDCPWITALRRSAVYCLVQLTF